MPVCRKSTWGKKIHQTKDTPRNQYPACIPEAIISITTVAASVPRVSQIRHPDPLERSLQGFNDRGLHENTVREVNLGWLPEDWYTERTDWGLPEKVKEDGTNSKLWIPAGLVIPCFHDGKLQRLRIRRHNITDGDDRYYILPGSSPIPMILGTGDIFIIVESELDAILLWQEVGDLVGVIAMGSAVMKPDQETSIMLHQAKKILVSLDNDAAGIKNSWKSWLSSFSNATRWPTIRGKDPTEAHLKGLNLRDWVKAGILSERRQTPIVKAPVVIIEDVNVAPVDVSPNSGSIIGQLEQFQGSPIIAIRIATTGDDPFKDKITAVTLCAPDHTPVVLDLTQSGSEEMTGLLKPLLGKPSEKVFYDAKTTLNFFHAVGIEVNGPLYDVVLADRILNAGLGERKREFHDVVNEYSMTSNDDDPAILLDLREATLSHLTDNNLLDTANLEFECIRAVAEMERNGIRADKNKLTETLQALSSRKDLLEPTLHVELGEINLNSPKQVKEALNKKGIRVNSTNQETLLPLVTKHSFLSDYLSYKKTMYDLGLINNLLSRIDANTGRLHPQYSQIGAPTGRFSCSDPNLHAIPTVEDFRSCFIADDGHKLVIADYSQIELRIVAEISQDPRMIDAYQKGEDLHRLTAAVVTGKAIAEITKEERSAAKAVNFGLIYAMGAKTLKEYSLNNYGVSMTLSQAKEFRSKFFSAYQGIDRWHQDVRLKVEKETRTLGNRRREWGDGHVNVAELLNTPVQGTSADITKRALCTLHERSQGSGIRIVGCIHDEIIIEASVAETDTAAQILKDSMIDAGKIYLRDVPILVDVSVVDNWYEKLMVLWICPEIPSGTFQSRPGKENFGSGDMGGGIGGGSSYVMVEPKGVKLPEGY